MTSGTAPEGAEAQRVKLLEIAATSADALIREILEALCRRDGLPLESSVVAGEPARNYDLAMRLGIGRVFGISEEKPEAPALPGVTREFRDRFTIIPDSGITELECFRCDPGRGVDRWRVGYHPSLDVLIEQARAHDTAQHATPAVPPPPVAAALDLTSASAHIAAAAEALGMPRRDPGDDRETAKRIRYARPGVPPQHALASVQALRAMGWGPGAEAAESKLAAVRKKCSAKAAEVLRRGTGVPFSQHDVMVDARYILEIIGSEGGADHNA